MLIIHSPFYATTCIFSIPFFTVAHNQERLIVDNLCTKQGKSAVYNQERCQIKNGFIDACTVLWKAQQYVMPLKDQANNFQKVPFVHCQMFCRSDEQKLPSVIE